MISLSDKSTIQELLHAKSWIEKRLNTKAQEESTYALLLKTHVYVRNLPYKIKEWPETFVINIVDYEVAWSNRGYNRKHVLIQFNKPECVDDLFAIFGDSKYIGHLECRKAKYTLQEFRKLKRECAVKGLRETATSRHCWNCEGDRPYINYRNNFVPVCCHQYFKTCAQALQKKLRRFHLRVDLEELTDCSGCSRPQNYNSDDD